MRIGFALPQHGTAAGPDGLIAIARRAEALGYASLWVWERLLAPTAPAVPYPIGDGRHPEVFRSALDPIETLTFVAGHTSRVTLGTSVFNIPWYQPVLLARRLATLDVLSRGRVRVGLGVGWMPDEFEALGVPWRDRGKRADEAVRVLKAVWTTDPVEFSGEVFQVPRAFIGPKPVHRPHPPIYMGAFTPGAMRRIAREANGWNPVGIPLAAMPAMFDQIRTLTREAGRDPAALELVLRANVELADRALGRDRADFHGTYEQIGDDVAQARAIGVTELFFDVWPSHPRIDTAEHWLAQMDELWRIAKTSAG